MPNITIQPIDALADLYEFEGQPVTDSRKVAERFGKRHTDVLRAIRSLLQSAPDEFASRNFALCSYVDGNQRQREMYRMTRDGFVLLAMGFTGQDSVLWKVAYINAFNRMAEEIARAAHVPAVPLTLHEQALKLQGESETSKALASIYGRGLRKRRDEKPVFARQLEQIERAMQICLFLGLDGLPDVD